MMCCGACWRPAAPRSRAERAGASIEVASERAVAGAVGRNAEEESHSGAIADDAAADRRHRRRANDVVVTNVP
jgi:hypothetical protein